MQPNQDESLLPRLQHLMLHESQGEKITHPATESIRNQREIRRTISMDNTQSPRKRLASSSVFSLLNTDSNDVNRTPPRHQKMPPMLARSCSPDDTPRASDVSRFGSISHALPRHPIFGTSPVQHHNPMSDPQHNSVFRRTDSIPSHLPPPPFLRKVSDSISDAESSTSEPWNPASGMRRSFSTVSSASSIEDHDHTFRPPRPSHYSSPNILERPRMTPPDLSPDSFFAPTYAGPPRTSANPTSSRAPISRTTKACNACRSRKVRCDAGGQAAALVGTEMPCSRCKDAGLTCVYSAQQRKRGPTPGSRRGENTSKLKLGENELASLNQSRRVSSFSGQHRGSHPTEDDQLVSARSLNRPTPYRSLSISTYQQDTSPSVLHSRAPPPSYPQHAYDYYSLQGDSQPRRFSPPGNNSPPWPSSLTTNSTASTSPNTPYLPQWAQMAPPPPKGYYSLSGQAEDSIGQQRPSSPSVMGWGGASSNGSESRKTSASRLSVSVHPYAGAPSRTTGEEEAFRNGYTMALEEIERQKGSGREVERDQARESTSLRLPPISVPVGPAT